MKPSNGATLYAFLASTIVVGGCAFGIHKLFDMDLNTWASPWLWGTFLVLWLAFAGSVLQQVVPFEILRQVEKVNDKLG